MLASAARRTQSLLSVWEGFTVAQVFAAAMEGGTMMKARHLTGLTAVFLIMLTFAAQVSAAGDEAAGRQKSAACIACHMADGNSVNPQWPKLAGQIPGYLAKQLLTFKDGSRDSEIMSPMVKSLSETDIYDLATYFAKQKRTPGTADPDKLALGEKLYKKGVFYTQVTACIGCHGMRGEGNESWQLRLAAPPAVLAPAIGGQHAVYLANQLKAFRSGERSNDVGNVMQNIAAEMSDAQIEAVAHYITQLE